MNKYEIEKNAVLIWNLLNTRYYWSYTELRTESHLSDMELGAAIGWLAHEDKIEIDMGNETLNRGFITHAITSFFDMSYKSCKLLRLSQK